MSMRSSTSGNLRHWVLQRVVKPAHMWFTAFGINPLTFLHSFRGLVAMLRDYRLLRRQNRESGNHYRVHLSMPCLADRYEKSGSTSGHYFYQDWLVARRIFDRQPVQHVDVGSRVDGFVAHVASFRPIEVLDIRPLKVAISAITFRQMDLMNPQDEFKDYCDSLS